MAAPPAVRPTPWRVVGRSNHHARRARRANGDAHCDRAPIRYEIIGKPAKRKESGVNVRDDAPAARPAVA
jgi:hypothetical protein